MTTLCSRSQPCNLLLVEDDADQAEMLKRLLEGNDQRYRVKLAASVAAAKNVLSTEPVDLILLDLNLDADSRGLQTLDQVKPLAPNLPIVIMTAEDDMAIAMEALGHGARQYLLKPVNAEHLAITIPYVISNHRNYLDLQDICAKLRARVATLTDVKETLLGATNEVTSEMLEIVDRLEKQTKQNLRTAQ